MYIIHNFLYKCKEFFIENISKLKISDEEITLAKTKNLKGNFRWGK